MLPAWAISAVLGATACCAARKWPIRTHPNAVGDVVEGDGGVVGGGPVERHNHPGDSRSHSPTTHRSRYDVIYARRPNGDRVAIQPLPLTHIKHRLADGALKGKAPRARIASRGFFYSLVLNDFRQLRYFHQTHGIYYHGKTRGRIRRFRL